MLRPTDINDYFNPQKDKKNFNSVWLQLGGAVLSVGLAATIPMKPDINIQSISRVAFSLGVFGCGLGSIIAVNKIDEKYYYRQKYTEAQATIYDNAIVQHTTAQVMADGVYYSQFLPPEEQPQPQYQEVPQQQYQEQEVEEYYQPNNDDDPMGIIQALNSLGVAAEWKGAIAGASFVRALVKVSGNNSKKLQKISTIQSLAEDLAAQLNLERTPLISRDKGNLAIDIPKIQREFIKFSNLIQFNPQPKEKLFIAVGVDLNSKLIEAELSDSDTCHFLIGGTTGSGKTEFTKVIIASLIWRYTPAKTQLVIIDPKRTKFNDFANLPWLYCPIVKDVERTIEIFEELVNEMESRYQTFEAAGCENIEGYWKLGKEMPRIVVVCDEFADYMGDKKDKTAIEKSCKRLGQKAREAGIHLILATQRPDQSVVTPILRSNLPGRIALRVKTEGDSNIILGEGANAHFLLGKGDLLFQNAGGEIRLQAPLLDDLSPLKSYRGEVRQSIKKPCKTDDIIDVEVREIAEDFDQRQNQTQQPSQALAVRIPTSIKTLEDAIALTSQKLNNPDSLPPLATGKTPGQVELLFKALHSQGTGMVDIIYCLWGITKGGSNNYKQARDSYYQLLAECCDSLKDLLIKINQVGFSDLKNLPYGSGVYFVFTEDLEIKYIGQSTDINRRWRPTKQSWEHQQKWRIEKLLGDGVNVKIGWVLTSNYIELEDKLIARFKPEWNGN